MNDFLPKRVASLQPSITSTMDRLGLLDRLAACTKYCADVAPSVLRAGTTIIHDSWSAKADEILAVHPDLVIASVPYQPEAVAEILKSGVPFLALAPRTLSDVYRDIATIGGVMGVSERATALIGEMQAEIEKARSRTQGLPIQRVFSEEWGKPIIRSQPWVSEIIEAAGGSFIGEAGKPTDAAQVRAEDPDVIFAAWCGAGDRVPLEKIVRDRQWIDLKAVRDRQVFCVNDELFNTPGPTLIAGLHAVLWALHPEHFPEVAGIRRITEQL